MFANCSKEEEIFPLTTPEIAEAQKADVKLNHCFRRNTVLGIGLEVRLVDNTYVVCKDGEMIILMPLQRPAVLWYHQYLQHPGLGGPQFRFPPVFFGIERTNGLKFHVTCCFDSRESKSLVTSPPPPMAMHPPPPLAHFIPPAGGGIYISLNVRACRLPRGVL